jgi:hypothetical protein
MWVSLREHFRECGSTVVVDLVVDVSLALLMMWADESPWNSCIVTGEVWLKRDIACG